MSIERPGWEPGPWDDEPDFDQFIDVPTGLVCFVKRSQVTGAWCGYVSLPPTHPAWHWPRRRVEDLLVHGGVTYDALATARLRPRTADPCGDLRLVGFDCAHWMDRPPQLEALLRELGHALTGPRDHTVTYRTIDYARGECQRLAAQLGPTPKRDDTPQEAPP